MEIKNKLKNISLILMVFAITLSINACKTKSIQTTSEDTTQYPNYTKATVIKSNLDGCTWLIRLEGEERSLEPDGLTKEFQVDNLKVWIQYKSNKGGMSICMAGEMVTITAISKR